MKAKLLVTFLNDSLYTSQYPIIKKISSKVGLSGMSKEECEAYFFGEQGLTMYDLIITKLDTYQKNFFNSSF